MWLRLVERKILMGIVIIVLIVSVAGYSVGLFSASSGETVTVTSSTTITDVQTITTTSISRITETVTSTTNISGDLLIPSPANSTAVIRMFYLLDGDILATLSIDKPSYSLGETVHIKATFTNISPEEIKIDLNTGSIFRIMNTSDLSVWTYPEYMWYAFLAPNPPVIHLTLSPGETKTEGYWSIVDWNMTGLVYESGYRNVYNDHLVPEGQYTLIWFTIPYNPSTDKTDLIHEEIPFTITKQD